MKTVICALALLAIAGASHVWAQQQADGYAGYQFNVTGGTGGTTSVVTTAAAFISAIGSSSAQFIMFSNTLDLGASNVDLRRNNKTVLGLGTNATIIGDIRIIRCTNVVIRNVFFTNPSSVGDGDALSCQHSAQVWIDHCTFHDCGDGSVDITHASDNFTLSWNKFYYTTNTGHNFVNLVGHTDFNCAEDCGRLHVTFHHNWWSTLCIERTPRVRYGRIHSYNNYFNSPGNNYCFRAAISSEVFAVRNVFENVDEPFNYFSDTGAPAGLIRSVSNATINCTGVLDPNDTVFTPPYVWVPDETNAVAGPVTNYSGAGIFPQAVFTATPTNGAPPLSVTFTNTSYGVITNCFWNFGDGNTTNTMTNVITRTFSTAGVYTVSLTVRGPVGSNTLTQSNYIVAASGTPPPVADFTGTPTSGLAPLLVTFTDTSTGSITNRFWNFGDGNTTNFTSATNPTHTYNAGTFNVSLTVSGAGGSSNLTLTSYIVATNIAPPVASFTATPTNGTAPLLVNFTDASTGSITNRFWDFGDGNNTNFAAATNPTHTYNPGVYTVALTVSGPGGNNTLTSNSLVTVVTTLQAWQLQYFGCTNCAQAEPGFDPDGDGLSNTNEFLAGTIPTNSTSALQIISELSQSTDMVITWTTAAGRTNVVQATAGDGSGNYTNNFADIPSSFTIITGNGDQTTNYTDTGGATNEPSRYYRIRLVP